MKTEDEIFKEFLKLDPNPGTKDRLWCDETRIIFPRWVTQINEKVMSFKYTEVEGYPDFVGYSKACGHLLTNLGISPQVFYDILKLGLTSLDDRPRCIVCGNPVTFNNIIKGYFTTCSNFCHLSTTIASRTTKDARNKPSETRRSRGPWNKHGYPEEAKRRISETLTRKYRSGEIITTDNKREKARQRMLGNKLCVGRTSPRKGVKLSQETIEKFRSKLIGRKLSKEHKEHIGIKSAQKFREHPEQLENFIKLGNRMTKHGHIKLEKVDGDHDFFYMSSWEETFIKKCDSSPEVIKILEGHTNKILYTYKKANRTYIPDAILILSNGTKLIIEVKPKHKLNTKKNRAKFRAAINWCRENSCVFLIMTEDEIFKGDNISFFEILKQKGFRI